MLGECETDFKLLLAKRSSNWVLGNLQFFPLELLSAGWPFLYSARRTSCYLLVTHHKVVFSSSPDFLKGEEQVHFKTSQIIYCWLFTLTTCASYPWRNISFPNSFGIEPIWYWRWFNKCALQMYFSKCEALQLLGTAVAWGMHPFTIWFSH